MFNPRKKITVALVAAVSSLPTLSAEVANNYSTPALKFNSVSLSSNFNSYREIINKVTNEFQSDGTGSQASTCNSTNINMSSCFVRYGITMEDDMDSGSALKVEGINRTTSISTVLGETNSYYSDKGNALFFGDLPNYGELDLHEEAEDKQYRYYASAFFGFIPGTKTINSNGDLIDVPGNLPEESSSISKSIEFSIGEYSADYTSTQMISFGFASMTIKTKPGDNTIIKFITPVSSSIDNEVVYSTFSIDMGERLETRKKFKYQADYDKTTGKTTHRITAVDDIGFAAFTHEETNVFKRYGDNPLIVAVMPTSSKTYHSSITVDNFTTPQKMNYYSIDRSALTHNGITYDDNIIFYGATQASPDGLFPAYGVEIATDNTKLPLNEVSGELNKDFNIALMYIHPNYYTLITPSTEEVVTGYMGNDATVEYFIDKAYVANGFGHDYTVKLESLTIDDKLVLWLSDVDSAPSCIACNSEVDFIDVVSCDSNGFSGCLTDAGRRGGDAAYYADDLYNYAKNVGYSRVASMFNARYEGEETYTTTEIIDAFKQYLQTTNFEQYFTSQLTKGICEAQDKFNRHQYICDKLN